MSLRSNATKNCFCAALSCYTSFMKTVFGLLLSLSFAFAQADGGRIVFVTPEGQLATVAPDGAELRVLSPPSSSESFQFPAWSPDGSSIAATGADAEGGFVKVLEDAEGAEAQELYRSRGEPPFYLYWSPDGESVSFLANHATEGIGLHIASSAEDDRVLATGSPFYWQWSASGEELFIHSGFTGEGSRLGFISRAEDGLSENLAPPGRFQSPGISPSGKYLAYASDGVRGPQVIIQSDERTQEALRREVAHQGVVALSWSPVADELALMSPEAESPFAFGPIQLLNADTGLLEPLTDNRAVGFFWSPDGRYIVYFAPLQGGGSGDAAEVLPETLPETLQFAAQRPALLGIHLIDVAERSDELIAGVVPSPQFVQQFLPFFDQYALSHSIWSSASDALVLPIIDTEARSLSVATVSLDGTVTTIAEGDMPFWQPATEP